MNSRRDKDGELVWCEFSAVPIELGGDKLMISVLRDTDRWTIATALRDSEEKILQGIPADARPGCIYRHETGRYLDMNDQLEPLLGMTRAKRRSTALRKNWTSGPAPNIATKSSTRWSNSRKSA